MRERWKQYYAVLQLFASQWVCVRRKEIWMSTPHNIIVFIYRSLCCIYIVHKIMQKMRS